MKYIRLLNFFWKMNRIFELNSFETQLYFKLLDIYNSLGWKNGFFKSNRSLCGELSMDERRLIRSRQRLVEVGLIIFVSGKAKQEPSLYYIVDACDPNDAAFNSLPESIRNSMPCYFNQSSVAVQIQKTARYDDRNLAETVPAGSSTVAEPSDIIRDVTETKTETKKRETIIKNKASNKPKRTALRVAKSEKDLFGEVGKTTSQAHTDDDSVLKRFFNDFNKICNRLSPVRSFSDNRKKLVAECIKEIGVENVEKMLQKAGESDYLAGNRFGWKADFNWIFTKENCERILEGTFDNHRRVRDKNDRDPFSKPSPFSFIQEAYTELINSDPEFHG